MRLTPAGLELIGSAYAEDMAVEGDLLSALSLEDRTNLAGLLAKLLADLEERTTSDGQA